MEASENAGTAPEGGVGPALHRVDLDRLTGMVGGSQQSPGLERLALMVGTILPRLTGGEGRSDWTDAPAQR